MFGILEPESEDKINEAREAIVVIETFLGRFDPSLHQSEASFERSRAALAALRASLSGEGRGTESHSNSLH